MPPLVTPTFQATCPVRPLHLLVLPRRLHPAVLVQVTAAPLLIRAAEVTRVVTPHPGATPGAAHVGKHAPHAAATALFGALVLAEGGGGGQGGAVELVDAGGALAHLLAQPVQLWQALLWEGVVWRVQCGGRKCRSRQVYATEKVMCIARQVVPDPWQSHGEHMALTTPCPSSPPPLSHPPPQGPVRRATDPGVA